MTKVRSSADAGMEASMTECVVLGCVHEPVDGIDLLSV